jgi:hypothetical protein
MNQEDFRARLQLIRERHEKVGAVVISPLKTCSGCGKKLTVEKFPRIRNTGRAAGVLDTFCPTCHKDYAREIRQFCRLVCIGCSEVVMVAEPGPEKGSGFVWPAGGCLHVNDCPACKAGVKKSAIIEKLAFYKARGLPYA